MTARPGLRRASAAASTVLAASTALAGLTVLAAGAASLGCVEAFTVPNTTPGGGGGPGGGRSAQDWPRFGFDAGRSNAPGITMGFTSVNVDSLTRQQVVLDGTVDGSAIYLHAVTVKGGSHNVFFVTTTYGKTIAVDADSGTILWEFTPAAYPSWVGSAQITTATPVADPDRTHLYAASPDGVIRKLAVADGSVLWGTAITKLPSSEKIASALNYWHGRVIATTGGYIGDAPPYQGHVAVMDAATGALLGVWNSLCSNRTGLLDPATCAQSGSAIWGRAGAVIDTTDASIYVATGNGLWDGVANWGDAVLQLDSLASRLVGNYTPSNTGQLDSTDTDLGSTAPVVMVKGYVAQGGKDGTIRLLGWAAMQGSVAHRGGEAQVVPTPSGGELFTAPAVVRNQAGATLLYAADNGGTAGLKLVGPFVGTDSLVGVWNVATPGTSPVLVDGLLFVYSPGGGLNVYEPSDGFLYVTLPCGAGHWNSPIVVDGRIALPEGNANDHRTSGVLDIWRIP